MPKKILLADDSVTIQKVISITFATEDYELTTVSDGDEAVEKAREIKPDLVMADVAMPGKNGYEVCESIKGEPGLGSTPVILLAGTFEPLNEEEARRVKADDSIVKPFESQELLDKVSGLLQGAGGAQEAGAEVPGLDLGEQGWEEGDFLGLDESFEEEPLAEEAPSATAPEESSDVDFLEGGMFEPRAEEPQTEEPSEEEPQVIGAEDYFDLELTEEDSTRAPEEPGSAPLDLDLTGIPDFSRPSSAAQEPVVAAGAEEEISPEPLSLEPEPAELEEVAEEAPAEAPAEEAFEIEDFEGFGELEDESTPVVEPAREATEPEAPALEAEEQQPWEEAAEDLIEVPEEVTSFETAVEPEGFGTVEQAPEPAEEFTPEPLEATEPTEDILEPEPDFTETVERAAEVVEQRATQEVAARLKDEVELPKEQVEEIVARVAREVVEKIAWDVVPDLAEELILAEINKFKSSLSRPK